MLISNRLGGVVFGAANLLLNLEAINNWRKLAKNLVCLLVEFELGGNQVGEVSEGLGGIKDLLFELVCEDMSVSRMILHSSLRQQLPQSGQQTHPQPAQSQREPLQRPPHPHDALHGWHFGPVGAIQGSWP